ncbi:MAG: hypothetical protein U0V87_08275 [Acidobacteriota bacterium]
MSTKSAGSHIERFAGIDRLAHALLMISFLGLATTGLPLLFSHSPWARWIAVALGGIHFAGIIHRILAVVLITVFLGHIVRVFRRVVVEKRTGLLWGPESLVPQPRDLVQLLQHLRYFLGRGPRPNFDHFTYWEKFDYWAVFWGMFVIGGSGLMLWFPLFFSSLLPGWILNIAMIVHGEEALLATGFIFMIHFFNENFRPSRFPMNNVMFTGAVNLEELAEERPAEFARYRERGGEGWRHLEEEDPQLRRWGRVLGGFGLIAGTTLLVLIVIGLLTL